MPKYESTWTFTTLDGGHVITAKAYSYDVWARIILSITVDGISIKDGKIRFRDLHGDYPIKVSPHVGIVKDSQKGMFGTKFTLVIDGAVIPAGEHVTISNPVERSKPMPAACPNCSSGIEVKWKKIGG